MNVVYSLIRQSTCTVHVAVKLYPVLHTTYMYMYTSTCTCSLKQEGPGKGHVLINNISITMNCICSSVHVIIAVYIYFCSFQCKFHVPPTYLEHQTDINERMRCILIDWLIQVHNRFKLLQETLYLTVSIIDRFLSVSCVHVQLYIYVTVHVHVYIVCTCR